MGVRTVSLALLAVSVLLVGCSKYYKYSERSLHTESLDRVFQRSFYYVELYLHVPVEIGIIMEKQGGDFPCMVVESITFLEGISGIDVHKAYEISGAKLSEEDSSFLAQDLRKWRYWFEDNKQHLSISKDYETILFEKGDVRRTEDISSTKCGSPF